MLYAQMTQDEQEQIIANAMYEREREYFYHSHNLRTYKYLLLTLPLDEWPEGLAEYRGMTVAVLRSRLASDPKVGLAIQYAWRDELRVRFAETFCEIEKTAAIYEALKVQLPTDRMNDIVAKAIKNRVLSTEKLTGV